FHGKNGPCFNCLFPLNNISQSLPNCNDAGVLGVLPGMLGTMQANLILQHILQMSDGKIGELFTLNGRTLELISYQVEREKNCTVCVLHQDINQELSFIHRTTSIIKSISFSGMRNKIERGEKFTLLDVRSAEEHVACNLGGILIPLQELENRLSELDKTLPVIVYCQSGQRSQAAAAILMRHHFVSVLTLDHQMSPSRVI
ncbi:MAG TPA: rhodanese-like domain-containing protein, partial [Gammaproteobacteria bacterium]|nr:rhodanese-like domain-containing protein [Gammaproteobacteria bacterium]